MKHVYAGNTRVGLIVKHIFWFIIYEALCWQDFFSYQNISVFLFSL